MAFHSSFDKVNSQSLVGFLFYLGNNLQFDHQGSYKPTTKIIREKQLVGKRVFWRMRGKTCTNKFFYASMSSDDLLCLASPFDVIRKFSVLIFTKAMFSTVITITFPVKFKGSAIDWPSQRTYHCCAWWYILINMFINTCDKWVIQIWGGERWCAVSIYVCKK